MFCKQLKLYETYHYIFSKENIYNWLHSKWKSWNVVDFGVAWYLRKSRTTQLHLKEGKDNISDWSFCYSVNNILMKVNLLMNMKVQKVSIYIASEESPNDVVWYGR